MEYADLQAEWYLPSSDLPLDDQKWLYYNNFSDCTPIKEIKENESMIRGECNNAGCNLQANSTLTLPYLSAISQLKTFSYKTSPFEIAKVLEELFGTAKEGHWLWIAQRWNPRPIILVLTRISKEITNGQITIKNPGAYFTYLMKYRAKRTNARRRVKP